MTDFLTEIFKRRLRLSYAVGFLAVAPFVPFAYLGVIYQADVVADSANVIGLPITVPVEILFGRGEGVPLVGFVAITLFEMNAVAFLVYLILSAWGRLK